MDEKTDPQIRKFSSAPPPEPLTPREQRDLKNDYGLLVGEVRTLRRLFITDEGMAICPAPQSQCAAKNMAETATIGVIELRAERAKALKLIGIVSALGIVLAAVINVAAAAVFENQAEAAVRKLVPGAVADELRRSSQTIGDTAYERSKQGTYDGMVKWQREQPVPPLVVHK